MELKLYDTLTREKRAFTPLDPARVRMYVCGPTVYDFAHIGNARPVIVFDVLFRLLRHLYGADHVTYVRNITDVDDKINARAAEAYPGLPLNAAIRKVTEQTERQFHEDVAALGCLPPTVEPRATEHIAEMSDADRAPGRIRPRLCRGRSTCCSACPSMPDYGRLARRSLDEMIAGARVDVAPYKRDPMDFVLVEALEAGRAGLAVARGHRHARPSRLAHRVLGDVVEAPGRDLRHPRRRHRSRVSAPRERDRTIALRVPFAGHGELSGCTTASCRSKARRWRRALGNFFTIRELLADWPGEVLRLNMLRTHYRQPIDWTVRGLQESQKTLDGWYDIIGDMLMPVGIDIDDEMIRSLCDDLNTPSAITRLHALAGEIRGPASGLRQLELKKKLKVSAAIVGMLRSTKREALENHPHRYVVDEDKVSALIDARDAARKAKNFKEADRIRDEFKAMGIELEDHKDGTTSWKVKR